MDIEKYSRIGISLLTFVLFAVLLYGAYAYIKQSERFAPQAVVESA